MVIFLKQSSLKVIILAFSSLINFAYAESLEYRSIIGYYGLNQDDVISYSEGVIDGEGFVAQMAMD